MPTTRRSARSRANLIAAASSVISEQGLHELTMRDVAVTASMSPGSVLYHYPSRDDLVLDVHHAAVSSYISYRSAASVGELDPRRRVAAMARAGIPPLAPADTIRLLFELHGLARRSAKHAALMQQLWDAELGLFRDAIRDGVRDGVFTIAADAETVAAQLLALEDGLGLHLVSNNGSLDAPAAERIWRAAAAGLLGCPELAEPIDD